MAYPHNLKLTITGFKVACVQLRFEKPEAGKKDEEFFWDEFGWHGYLYKRLPIKADDWGFWPEDDWRWHWTVRETDENIIVYQTYEDAVKEVDRLWLLAVKRVQFVDGSLRMPPELHEGLRIDDNGETYEDFRYKFFVEPVVEVGKLYENEFTHTYERWKSEDNTAAD